MIKTLKQIINRRGIIITSLILVFLIGIGSLGFVLPSESRVKPYYSGEAISFQGQAYVGTVNTGTFELFVWQNGQFNKKSTIISTYHQHPRFSDLHFSQEGSKLYVYLIDGRYLYKYDITNPMVPKQEVKIKDNAWDWFQGLDEVSGYLVTIGTKGVKIWNNNLEVINSFEVYNKFSENISFSPYGKFIFNLEDGKIKIFNTETRQYQTEIKLETKHEEIRKIYNDPQLSLIYVIDDFSLKAFNFAGKLVKEFKHISSVGYDVVPSSDGMHLYFSDGIGIVKVNKYTFKPVDWEYTTGVQEGSWLIRLKAVNTNQGEKIIGFNASNIIIMDRNLNILGHQKANQLDFRPVEPLFLGVDKNRAPAGSEISLRGGGFAIQERVIIEFGKQVSYAQTNDKGRFSKIIEVPDVDPGAIDIKVIGIISDLNYSLGFHIE